MLWLGLQLNPGRADAATSPPVGAGWWVVLQVFPADKPDRKLADPQRIESIARRCGHFVVFNEPSDKFREFQGGYNTFLVGSFAASRDAERTKTSLTRCFPDAFVKYGEFVGE